MITGLQPLYGTVVKHPARAAERPVGEAWHKGEGAEQRAKEGKGDGVCHRREQLGLGALEGEQWHIGADNDEGGKEDRAGDLRGSSTDVVDGERNGGLGIVTVTGLAARPEGDQTGRMTSPPDPHYRHRFAAEIISYAVWLYHVFSLSFRDVELILAERGVLVSYETVRRWCKKFAASFADRLRRRRPRPGDKWHMDEVFIRIQGVQHYLWRAVDQHGVVLDILVQARRDAQAAKRFFKRLLKGLQYEPRVIVTDKLRSYGVAQRQLLPGVEHRQSRYLNNRAENSHRPTRRRERQMQRFKSSWQAQDFLSAHSFIYGHFRPQRHQLAACDYREIRSNAFNVWHEETCIRNAA